MTVTDFEAEEKKKNICWLILDKQQRNLHSGKISVPCTVMGCRPVSSKLITIRIRASPFNIKIIQAYAPSSDYNDDAGEEFYDHLQEILLD